MIIRGSRCGGGTIQPSRVVRVAAWRAPSSAAGAFLDDPADLSDETVVLLARIGEYCAAAVSFRDLERVSRLDTNHAGIDSSDGVANGVTVFLDVVRGSSGNYWSCFDDVSAFWAYVPPAPLVDSPTGSSLNVDVDPGCNSANSTAEYAISIGGGAYTLGASWVQAGGNVGTTAVWQTDAAWAAKTVTGLTAGISYTFKVKARYSSVYVQESTLGVGAAGTPAGCPALTSPTGAQADPTAVCVDDSAQLSANPGSGGDTVEWFTGGCRLTPVVGGTSPTVTPAATTTYYARTKQSSSGCTSASCATVTVTVNVPVSADFDRDCDVDEPDVSLLLACMLGPQTPQNSPSCQGTDLDRDTDVDQSDFGILQRCSSGSNILPDPNCDD